MQTIETAEVRRQRQIMLEISKQNIIDEERRKKERERPPPKARDELGEESGGSGGSSSGSDSSDDAPLIYKLRKRNQTTTSYRFNEYDDLINSAIKEEMDEVKGAGNLGRGKDISTIIEADREEKRNLKRELDGDDEGEDEAGSAKNDDEAGNSSGSDVIRRKKTKKKKTRKLNNLDSSDDQSDADESFKGSTPSSDSEVDEEELSQSSVSESSLDMPRKKGAKANRVVRTRQKRFDTFINDNDDNDSDDEPLIVKRTRKKKDSDEEEFDMNDDDDEDEEAEDIDSEDLCDDSDSSDSSENGWQKKKKKKPASYDHKPRKPVKKKVNEDEDKAFRAGISKKKILKQQELISENESDASEDENAKSRTRTRGKKLLYLIEDDLESDESDGIRPGVKRPETPPEEREMFFKKQEEIKRMLAAKDTEAAKKLALPTIEPINIPIERPETPTSIPSTDEPSSLSTIPMNVIESAKALDTDYNRAKPFLVGSSKSFTPEKSAKDMDETELARMMEDEDFARHQLKLAGDAIAKKKLLEFEAKEDAFIGFSRSSLTLKDREMPPARAPEVPSPEKQKRAKKPKTDKAFEQSPEKLQSPQIPSQHHPAAQHLPPSSMPPSMQTSAAAMPKSLMQHHTLPPQPHLMQQQQPIMANFMHQQPPHTQPSIIQQSPYVPSHQSLPPSQAMPDRPSVLSSYMNRPLNHPGQPQPPPQHLKMMQSSPPPVQHHPMKPLQSPPPGLVQQLQQQQQHLKSFSPKNHPHGPPPPQMQQQQMQDVEMKKERKKKTSSRSDPVPEGNLSKHVKLDAPPTSVIHPPMNQHMMERDQEKAKCEFELQSCEI